MSGVALLLTYLLTTHGTEAAKRFWEEYEVRLAEDKGSVQLPLEALVKDASIPELLIIAGIPPAIAPSLHDILEAVCTLDGLFQRANGSNLAKVGTFLRDSFLHTALLPPEFAAQRLAKRVASLSLSSILQFLHNLRPAIDNLFLAEFVRTLSVQPGFHKTMEGYSHRSMRKCRMIIHRLDPGIAGYFNDCVSEEIEFAALLRSSLIRIENAIVVSLVNGQLTDTVNPKNRTDRLAQYVFRGLSSGDQLEKKAANSSQPFAYLRSLSYAFASIPMEPAVLSGIMSQMSHLFGSLKLSCTPEDLFLLLRNLKKIDEGVWKVAATTAAREYDVTGLARGLDPFGALILWHIRQADPLMAMRMAKEYFAHGPCSVLGRWRLGGFDGRFVPLLANLSQIDLGATQKWVCTDSSDLWLEQLTNTTADVSVTCLATMYFVDADLAKELLHKLIFVRFAAGAPIKPSELALAGLSARLFYDPSPTLSFPSAREIADWLSSKHPFSAWAFAAYAVRRHDPKLLHDALYLAEIYMKNRDIRFSISEQLEGTLHPELRAMLADILNGVVLETA